MYRVAVNNGISVQKLMELNGLNSNSEIEPGQQLRVR
ncbi:LysM peptidoglycan-binding domain-containing protein [Pediococcus acidilactici]